MPATLPPVEVVRKFVDETFDVSTPVMVLRWAESGPSAERLWELPEGLSILGAPPEHFGLRVGRHSPESYSVHLVWNRTHLSWPSLSRMEILGSSLASLLAVLQLDLWSLLEQPPGTQRRRSRAA